MKNKIHYVYLTTNLINGKQYVGDHTISNSLKYYVGSGTILEIAIIKYGQNNFFKEILEWFNTKEEAFNSQEKYIKLFNTLTPNGYNISPTGGHNVKGCISKETCEKISKALKGRKKPPRTKEHIKKITNTRKQKGYVPWNKNKKMSKEFGKKISNSLIGKKYKKRKK